MVLGTVRLQSLSRPRFWPKSRAESRGSAATEATEAYRQAPMKRWTSSFLALALAPLWLLPVHQVSGQNTAPPQSSQDQPSSSDVPDTIVLPESTVISVPIAD